jgi:uncharacterized membrane protein
MVVTPQELYGTTGLVNTFGNFIQNNFIWIVGLIIVGFVVAMLFKGKSKTAKIISRSQVERQKRISELSQNRNTVGDVEKMNFLDDDGNQISVGVDSLKEVQYNILFHGSKFLGKITNIGFRFTNPNKERVFEIVYNPKWFWEFANPFKKELLRIYEKSLILNKARNSMVILPTVSIDSHLGLFYDVPFEINHVNWINERLFEHDKEDLSSFYYVESQKRSTFDLEFAHAMAMKEKELQIELARKKGKMSTI